MGNKIDKKINNKNIYFDNNATTPIHPEVEKTLKDSIKYYGNPSSLHSLGRQARNLIEENRVKVADFINANSYEIVFVGSGSEGNNTVLQSFACQSKLCDFDHCKKNTIIISKIEHPCIKATSGCLVDRGMKVIYLDVDRFGKVNINQLKEILNNKVSLVSIMMANNEIGTIQNIKEITDIVHANGSFMHTDAVQAVGKIDVDVKDLGVDFLTLSAHKIYGPKGIGAIYIKKNVHFCPLIRGGHQEKNRRAGTENTLGIIGLGKAIEMRSVEIADEKKKLLKMRNKLKKGIEDTIPDIHFNGHPTDVLPNTLSVSFKGVEGEAILLYLDLEGIAVSTGSACASGSLDPSYVLLATGLPVEYAHSSIRFSLGRQNSMEEVEYVTFKLAEIVKKLRNMSSAY